MNRANLFKTITIACLFFALSAGNVSGALPEERPGAFAMVIDVPIRILSLGLAVVGTAFFIVALPFDYCNPLILLVRAERLELPTFRFEVFQSG